MKYRRLTSSEREELKDEFVRFLVSNGIDVDEWEKIKAADSEKSEGLIDVFSDVVWEKTLPRIRCAEQRTPKRWTVYLFKENEAEMIALEIEKEGVPLNDPDFVSKVANGSLDFEALGPQFYRGKKAYENERSKEVFSLLETGAKPCNEVVYMSLKKLIK